MKPLNEAEVRTIHPEVINEIGMEAAITMLSVGRDLRDGTIKPRLFNMKVIKDDLSCGTAHCIAGWVAFRMNTTHIELFVRDGRSWNVSKDGHPRLNNLFGSGYPSEPALAADAIDRYVYDYEKYPWKAT